MFEPLKLQEAYVTIRNAHPQLDVLLFGPEFFVKAHHIYDRMQVEAPNSQLNHPAVAAPYLPVGVVGGAALPGVVWVGLG